MNLVIDASFGANDLTAAILKSHGVTGAIGYVNTVDPSKNLSKVRFEDWINNGIQVGLVFENFNNDPLGGSSAGSANAAAGFNQAKALGYDINHCVLFFAADFNAQPSQLPVVDQYFNAVSNIVPYPGIYGNRLVLDTMGELKYCKSFWQSDADAWSNGISPLCNLKQQFNDPRVSGLPADANDVLKIPIGLMGEKMSAPIDYAKIKSDGYNNLQQFYQPNTEGWNRMVQIINQEIPAIAAAVVKALPPATTGSAPSVEDIATAVANELQQRLTA